MFAAAITPAHALTKVPGQARNEIAGIVIDPLIDGLVRNGRVLAFRTEAAGDNFWRPSQQKFGFDVPSNGWGLYTNSAVRIGVAAESLEVSPIGEIPGH